MGKLAHLKIENAPAAFVEFARKHNALIDLIAGITGNGLKFTISETNIVADLDYDVLDTAIRSGPLYQPVVDVASFAAPVTSVAGKTGNVTLVASDIGDFNANVDLRIANIASIDVVDSSSKIAKALRHPANYVTPTDYPSTLKAVTASGNITIDTIGFVMLKSDGKAANIAFASLAHDLAIDDIAVCNSGSPANIDTLGSAAY